MPQRPRMNTPNHPSAAFWWFPIFQHPYMKAIRSIRHHKPALVLLAAVLAAMPATAKIEDH